MSLHAGANSGSNNNLFYSFNQGLVHFIVFSAEAYAYNSGAAFLANQLAFMKADLAAVNRSVTPWVVVSGNGWGSSLPYRLSPTPNTIPPHDPRPPSRPPPPALYPHSTRRRSCTRTGPCRCARGGGGGGGGGGVRASAGSIAPAPSEGVPNENTEPGEGCTSHSAHHTYSHSHSQVDAYLFFGPILEDAGVDLLFCGVRACRCPRPQC